MKLFQDEIRELRVNERVAIFRRVLRDGDHARDLNETYGSATGEGLDIRREIISTGCKDRESVSPPSRI